MPRRSSFPHFFDTDISFAVHALQMTATAIARRSLTCPMTVTMTATMVMVMVMVPTDNKTTTALIQTTVRYHHACSTFSFIPCTFPAPHYHFSQTVSVVLGPGLVHKIMRDWIMTSIFADDRFSTNRVLVCA